MSKPKLKFIYKLYAIYRFIAIMTFTHFFLKSLN